MKKTKLKVQNIIILINILILLVIISIYGYRLVYYYKIEHPKLDKALTLSEAITLKKNITTINDGLYKEDNNYIFKGTDVNNYLEYSGYLFRIISVDENNNVKAITDKSLTSLAFGIDDYNTSYIKSWLNNEGEHEGIFYKSLNNPTNYLVDTNFCTETLEEDSKECKDNSSDLTGLLSLIEYRHAGGSKSYLNTSENWWLANTSKEGNWYVYSNGKINDVSHSGKEYYSYGVKPVVTFKGTIAVTKGDGTKINPYKIENEGDNILKSKSVGKYVSYSDMTWRIIEKNDSYIRLALDGFIKENNEDKLMNFSTYSNVYSSDSGIGKYLNTVFFNSLDNTYMIEGTIYTNRYDSTVDFDYKGIYASKISAKVGMMQVGDLFINDYTDYYLVSRTSTYVGTVYKVIGNNSFYADLPTSEAYIRPTIFLNIESPIKSGDGTKEKPYIIG